jgi:8-amino-7-oxononanoate synthase
MDAGLYPYFRVLSSSQGPEVVHRGQRLIMMGSNNYLGLSTHPEVRRAASRAIDRYGTGCSGSRLLNGTLDLHQQLEERLADHLGQESALVWPSGFQANLGIVAALTDRNDLVVIDKMDHASIYDGTRLSFATIRKFRHNNLADLERILAKHRGLSALVVVDGVYSMEGDLADLPGLVDLCRRYGAALAVDDAHGLGVLGKGGRGTANHFGLDKEVDVLGGTFSKSLASVGGYAAGDRDVIKYLKHHARSLMFSASLPPASTAAALTALDLLDREPHHQERLWANTRHFQEGVDALGFNTGTQQSPIIPIRVGDEQLTLAVWKRLFEEGVFSSPILYPAVPPGMAMIRTSCMATHTEKHLERALDAFERVGRETGLI